jgi:phosphatidylglycerol:prolipoprotein diacylglycerol transferase
VPIAVIAFDFDPLLRLAEGLVVRWQTVALAAAIATALVVAGLIARRDGLRPDDLLFIAIGTVPGAVVGGRIGYVLLHLPYYQADPGAIIDPSLGAMELALGVVGGLLTGSAVAALLGAPVGRWRHALVLPLLFILGVGKLTMILGGAGQGTPSVASWATAFLGPGPWGSLAPALPSVPSQAIEGVVTLAILLVVTAALWLGAFSTRDGRVLFAWIAIWAFARAAVASTWRDDVVIAGLDMGSIIAIAVGLGAVAVLVVMTVRARRRGSDRAGDPAASSAPSPGGRPLPPATAAAADGGPPATPGSPPLPGDPSRDIPTWPEPGSRPRF